MVNLREDGLVAVCACLRPFQTGYASGDDVFGMAVMVLPPGRAYISATSEGVMAAYRNFVLGVILGAALVAPTSAYMAVPAQGENALAAFASARADVETRLSASAYSAGTDILRWVARNF
jgi:hypothetical protein